MNNFFVHESSYVDEGCSIWRRNKNLVFLACFIGAGTVVVKDISAFACVVGNPARFIGWRCQCGEKLDSTYCCHRCASKYTLKNNKLEKIS